MSLAARIALSVLACGAVCARAQAAPTVSAADRHFVAGVSQGGMFEVQAGEAAADQGGTQAIKDQGTTEAHDHKLVGDKLTTIAGQAGITFPTDLNPMFTKELADLKAASGHAFDVLYLKDMIAIHNKDGAAFAGEAKNGTDPDLRAFAAETHSIVESHLGELHATRPGTN